MAAEALAAGDALAVGAALPVGAGLVAGAALPLDVGVPALDAGDVADGDDDGCEWWYPLAVLAPCTPLRLPFSQPAEPAEPGGSGAEPTDWTDAPPAVAAEEGAPVPCVSVDAEPVDDGVAVADAPDPAESAGDAVPVGVAEFDGAAVLADAAEVAAPEPEGDAVGVACVVAFAGVAVALLPDVRFWSAPASVSVSPL